MNLRTLVGNWLKCHGYDGLYHADTECGCKLDDLMPCDEPSPNCEAGYLGSFVLGHSGYAFGGKEAFRICAHKPAECFADAKPEEPRVEERTLRSPDGSFVMTVWLKDNPPRIEARIVQQPEEWRGDDEDVKVIAEPVTLRLAVHSYHHPALYDHALVLRGSEREQDDIVFECRFKTPVDRDAHLLQLEATVAAMPRLADQFKVGDRVVVAGHAKPDEVYSVDLPEWIGRKGKIERVANLHARIDFDDGNEKDNCIWLINLRHEREDERPKEKPIRNGERVVVAKGDDEGQHGVVNDAQDGVEHITLFVRYDDGRLRMRSREYIRRERADERPAEPKQEPPPVHMTVALVDGRIQVNLDPVEGGGA